MTVARPDSTPSTTRSRRLLFAGLSIVAGAVAGCGLLEVGFRVFAGTALSAELSRLQRELATAARTEYVSHPFASHVRAPGEGIDRFGFAGPDRPRRKPVGVKRIACIGGSTTESYAPVLARLLERRAAEKTEVLNFGLSAWSSAESLSNLLLHAQDYGPDALIIHNVVNDIWARVYPNYRSDYRHWRKPTEFPTVGWFTRAIGSHSHFYLWLTMKSGLARFDLVSCMSKPRPRGLALDIAGDLDPETASGYRRNLRTMIHLGRAIGARPYLMTMPFDESRPDGGVFAQVILDHNRIMNELGEELGVDVIDLYAAIRGRRDIWSDLVHFKPRFLSLKAEQIVSALARTGALRIRPEDPGATR